MRKGQTVSALDVIGEANQNPKHVLLDITRGLGVNFYEIDQHIQRNAGDIVAEGDILANDNRINVIDYRYREAAGGRQT